MKFYISLIDFEENYPIVKNINLKDNRRVEPNKKRLKYVKYT